MGKRYIFKNTLRFFLFFYLFLSICFSGTAQMIIGYYPNYRTASFAATVPYAKMTHLHFFSLNPTSTSYGVTDGSLWYNDSYSWFTSATFNSVKAAAKSANPNIKIVIVTGGAPSNDGGLNSRLELIGSTPAILEKFCNNIVGFLLTNSIDGWDLDWEYPNTTSARTAHQNLLARMRQKFDSVNTAQCKTWTISIAVGGGNTDRTCFNPSHLDYCNAAVINSLDYVNIMTYDGQTPASSCGYTSHTDYNLMVKGLTDWVTDKGWPKSKLCGGTGFYDNYGNIFSSGGNNSTYYNATYWGTGGIGNPGNTNKLSYLKTNGYKGIAVWEVTQDNQCSGTVPSCYSLLDGMTQWKNANSWIYTPPVCLSGAPVANFTTNSITGCVNSSITFTDASTNTPTSWSWKFGPNASPSTATNAGPQNVTFSAAGIQTITLTSTNSNGSSTYIGTVTIVGLPSSSSGLTGPASVCANATANFTLGGASNVSFYNWTVPPGAVIQSGLGTSNINILLGTTSGSVILTAGNICGTNNDSNGVSVLPIPVAPAIISGNPTVCSSSSNTYSIVTVPGALSYVWTIPSGWTGSSTSTSINTVSNSSSGSIQVKAVNGCGSSNAQILNVVTSTVPSQPLSISGASGVCPNSINIFNTISVSGATGYSWILPTGWTGNSTTNTISATSNSTGGTISVRALNSCGTSTSQNFLVSITTGAGNAGAITGTSTICSGLSGNVFTIPLVTGASGYTWSVPSGSSISGGANTNSITLTTGSISGTLTVTPTSACGNGSPSSLLLTIVNPLIIAGSLSGLNSICGGSTNVYSIVPVSWASSYSWNLPSGWAGTSTLPSISAVSSTNSGTISVTANSAICGSSAPQSLVVNVGNAPSTPSIIGGNSSVCPASSNTYSVTSVAGVSYNWTIPSGWSGGGNSSSINLTSGNVGGNILVKAFNACGTSSSSNLNVSVNGGLPVSGSTQCGAGVATLNVLTTGGPFLWYSSSIGGASLFSGNTYMPVISTTSIFYVTQSSVATGQVGMTTQPATDIQVYDNILGQRVFPSASNSMVFNTSMNNVTINSVQIWTGHQSQMYLSNFWITVEDNSSNVLLTSGTYSILPSYPTANPNYQTVSLNVLLTSAGTYKMRIWSTAQADAWGTVASGQTLPVSDPSNILTLSSGYNVFTNVNFQYGGGSGTCGRTPVVATVSSSVIPTVSALATSTTICAGNNVTFTAVPVNGGTTPTFQWKNNGVNISGATSSTWSVTTLSGSNAISVSIISNAACAVPTTATSSIVNVLVNAPPSNPTSISGIGSLCAGSTATYTIATISGASAYIWSVPSGSVINNGQGSNSINSTIGGNGGIISVKAANSCGTSAGINLALSVNSIPGIVGGISGLTSVCSNQAGISYSIGTVAGATIYNWILPTGAVVVSGAGTNMINVNFGTVGGNIFVSPINSCGTGTSSNLSVSINANLFPIVSVNSSSTNVCSGTAVTFTATGTNGGTVPTYQWYKNGTFQTTGSNYSYVPANGDNIKVVQMAGGSLPTCLSSTIATSSGIAITVNSTLSPTVSINSSSTNVCSGTAVTFTASGTNGGTVPTYQWYKNGTFQTTGSNYSYVPADGDNIKVVQMAGGSLPTCLSSTIATSSGIAITVNSALTPTVSVNSSSTNVCSGTAVTFTATGTNGGTVPTYQWYKNGTFQTTGSNYSYVPANGDNIKVVQMAGGSLPTCLSSTIATSSGIVITVNSTLTPTVSVNSSSTNVCSGTAVTFTATGTNGGSVPTYQWYKNGTFQTTGSNYSYVPANGDNIKVVQMAGGTIPSCLNSTSITSSGISLNVNPLLPTSVNISTSTTAFCNGSTAVFNATPVNGGNSQSYSWYVNGLLKSGTGATYSYIPSNGDVVVSVLQATGTCLTNNPATSNGINVIVQPTPIAAGPILGNSSLCANATSTYSIAGLVGATGYNWTIPSGATILSGIGTNIVSIKLSGASGQISIVPQFVCGTGTSSKLDITLTSVPGSPIGINGNATVCASSTGTYSVGAVVGATSYSWSVPSGSSINSGQGSLNASIVFGSTSGNISVTASNTCGAGGSILLPINISGGTGSIGSTPVISGPSSVCANSSGNMFSIATVVGATGYNWNVPNGASITTGNGSPSIVVNFGFVGGNVSVVPSNGCNNGNSSSLSVGINSIPASSGTISGPNNVCASATGIEYSVPLVNGATNYNWTIPIGASIINGEGSNTILVDFGSAVGNISVVPSNTCGTSTGSNLTISLTSILTPTVVIAQTSGNNPTCSVDQVSFTASSTNGGNSPVYQWYINGAANGVSGPILNSANFNNGDKISALLTSSLLCASTSTVASNNIILSVISTGTSPCIAPVVTSITGLTSIIPNQSDVIYTVPIIGGASYLWTVPSGAVISSGQGTNSITVQFGSAGGDVTLVVSNQYGSNTLTLSVTTGTLTDLTSKWTEELINAYPNPFVQEVTLKVLLQGTEKFDLSVSDGKGLLVESKKNVDSTSEFVFGNDLSAGIYIVSIRYRDKVSHLKLVKIN